MTTQADIEAELNSQKAKPGETFTMTTMHRGTIEVTVVEPCENKNNGHWHCMTCDKGFANNFEKGGHFENNSACRAVWICHEHGAEQP